jgi:16S rRNA (cytosine967-C5)-methyltransferase
MARAQLEILAAGADALRPGGLLVYSTCTISPAENERLIARFLDSRPHFRLDDLAAELPALRMPPRSFSPAQGPDARPRAALAPGPVLTLPHRDRTAGFFIARLRRE